MAEPKIYTKNYVSSEDLFTISHGSATQAKLYDRDKDSKYLTSGANADATIVTIVIAFYEGTTATSRAIDTLIVLNHNLKSWLYDYWNGSAWVNLYTATVDATTDRVVSHTLVTTSQVRLTINSTQVADAEKFIGELFACKLTLDVGKELDGYDVSYRQKVKQMQLGDGSARQAVVRWSPNRTNKYEARIQFKNATVALHDALKAIKEANQAFLWYPETTQRPQEIYYVNWTNPWSARYSSTYKLAGYDLAMDVKEV